ncbi:DUF4232 domain-containing protein [Streptomyces sp. A012304]|uniref:DUF4232 domain-containing protein n=1 Tax=Streptomyces sp. A012304 TaxID=375446 RepID=UPI002230826B|nr:DUF4232 domain-containing protein [Streptomyces sp. A012304]GKQ39554.1 hypothetical protein ALMP_60810 [Streptomyces sp. A012304]
MRIRRTSRLLVPALAGLAALSLTACQNGTGTRDEGASAPVAAVSPAPPAEQSASGTGTATGTGKGAATGTDTATGKGTGKGAGKGADTAKGGARNASDKLDSVLCNGSNTKVTAQPVPRPLNHMLITVTNTGSKACDLTYFPVLRFDQMQWVPQGVKETQPQTVTTLAPGESGYAGVLLSAADGSGKGGATAKKLTVGFQGRTPNSNGGAAATPSLPAGGVYYDTSLQVTYWQPTMDEALSW